MLKLWIKISLLGVIFCLLVYVGASAEPSLRAKNDKQFQQNWISGKAVSIENLKKWEFKNIQFNEQYINSLQQTNHIIVLGSSHAMFIRAAQFNSPNIKIQPNLTFFNHWITGINNGLEIPQHFYRQYQQRKLAPRLVVLGIDPWLLQGASDIGTGDTAVTGNDPFSLPPLTGIPSFAPTIYTLTNVFDLSQNIINDLKQQLTQIQREINSKTQKFQYVFTAFLPTWATITQPMTVNHIMNRDGSFTCAPDVIRCQWDNMEAQRQKVREGLPKNINIFSQPMNPALQQQFEAFIQNMKSSGSHVIFVMTPLHPIAYDALKTMPNMKLIDAYYRNVASNFNIPMVGAFDPTLCQLVETDFVDADHLNEVGTAKLLTQPNCTTGPWAEVIAAVQP